MRWDGGSVELVSATTERGSNRSWSVSRWHPLAWLPSSLVYIIIASLITATKFRSAYRIHVQLPGVCKVCFTSSQQEKFKHRTRFKCNKVWNKLTTSQHRLMRWNRQLRTKCRHWISLTTFILTLSTSQRHLINLSRKKSQNCVTEGSSLLKFQHSEKMIERFLIAI